MRRQCYWFTLDEILVKLYGKIAFGSLSIKVQKTNKYWKLITVQKTAQSTLSLKRREKNPKE